MIRTGLTLLVTLAAVQVASAPEFENPVDCDIGTTCYIEDYFDHDTTSAKQDFMCGLNTRDGHGGTDFAVLSFEAMHAGVDVYAVADGTVIGVRDGRPDSKTVDPASEYACGNGVHIDHGDGWRTQYCHLKNASVAVDVGAQVSAGTVLGQIGLSGRTNHPHLHLSVFKDGEKVDPFAPWGTPSCQGDADGGLWKTPPQYYAAGVSRAGFSTQIPSLGDVRSGTAKVDTIHGNDPIVLYALFYPARPGDILRVQATGPNGTIFQKELAQTDPKRTQMQAYGRRAPSEGWPEGRYHGRVMLVRDDQIIGLRHTDVIITH